MRITAYSDRLLDDLDVLDWPDKVKTMQRNWIGRSTGAAALFAAPTTDGETVDLEVFTTRPDTLFGATYLVLAPEHELVDRLVAPQWPAGVDPHWTYGADSPAQAVAAYRQDIAAKSDLERQENKAKTGVFLGVYATNPANGEQVPVFIADYVLAGYGTGAIMAVPGHDQRDWEFAHEFGLPVIEVIAGGDISEAAYTGDGVLVNSDYLNGFNVAAAKEAITARLESEGRGQARIEYKLRDWLFARQRYWGEPFPIVYDSDERAHALDDAALPVELPDVPDYSPVLFDPDDADSEPSPPLAKATEWVHVDLDLGDGLKPYTRDTNVMPQWAASSWYELRYTDPHNAERFCGKENEAYWMGPRPAEHGPGDPGGVDLYVGGAEHAVLHLLYCRFWHKVLYDLGHVSSREPYRGGPVKRDAALCLAVLRVGAVPDDVPGLRHVAGRMAMVDLDADPESIGPLVEGVRIFAGYSGWTIGQLEGEIERDDWIVLSALPSDVLVQARVDLWGRVLRRQPQPLSMLATHPIDISRN